MKLLVGIQSIYVVFLNCVASVSSKIAVSSRKLLVDLSVTALLIIGVLKYCSKDIKNVTHFHQWAVAVGTVLLVILTIALIDKKKYYLTNNMNSLFWTGWIGSFAWMLVLSFFHRVEAPYQIWALLCVLLFPMLFIACAQSEKYKELFNTIADRTITIAFVFFVLTIIIGPFLPKEKITADYLGLASNPNHNGMLSTGFYSAALYKLFYDKKRPLVYLLLMGMCIALSVVSVTRASTLAIALESILAVVYLISRKHKRNKPGRLLLQIAIGAAIVYLIAFAAGFVLKTTENLCLTADANSVSTEQGDTYQKLNHLSSGRIGLWKAYIDKSTFFGNGWSEEPVIEGLGTSRWAHNTAIEILYISGVPAFIGYLVWSFACLMFIIKSIFERSNFKYEKFYTMLVLTGYFTEAMLEVTIFPMTTGLAFMAWIGMIPVTTRESIKHKTT